MYFNNAQKVCKLELCMKSLSMIDDSNLSMSRCPETSANSVTHIIENFNSRLSCHLPNANVISDSLTDNLELQSIRRKQDCTEYNGPEKYPESLKLTSTIETQDCI